MVESGDFCTVIALAWKLLARAMFTPSIDTRSHFAAVLEFVKTRLVENLNF